MKKVSAIILVSGFMLINLAGTALCEEAGTGGWLEKTIAPALNVVKDAVGNAVKGLSSEIENRIMEMLIPETGIGGGINIEFYYPQLSDVNARLAGMQGLKGSLGGFLPVAEFRYSITPEFQLGYAGSFMSYSMTGNRAGETYTTGISLNGQFHALSFVYKPKLKSNFRFYAGADIGWVWADYSEDSGFRPGFARELRSWSGSGLIAIPFAGFQYKFDRIFALGADCGYAIATIPSTSMVPQAGTAITDVCPQLELSGLMVRFGPQIHF